MALFGNVAADWVDTAQAAAPTPPAPQPTNPAALGATGAIGDDEKLAQYVQHDAGNPVALASDSTPLADLPSGPLGIPGIVLDAYLKAQQRLAFTDPSCRLPWWLLAGIGKVESDQAENGEVDQNGNTIRPIYGPLLDGSNGFAAIPDVNDPLLGGTSGWARAVGPMQFLPATWRQYGGNGNPNNVYDAALAAGRYLCASGGDLSQPAQQAIAVFNYNHSDSYVRLVLIWADAYEQGVTPLPETVVSAAAQAAQGSPAGSGGGTVTVTGPDGTIQTTITSTTSTTTITTTVTTTPDGQTTSKTTTTPTTPTPAKTCTTTTTTTTTASTTTTPPLSTTPPPPTTTTTPPTTTTPTTPTTPTC